MLKRKSKMLVGVLALFLVMTIGYALFSDTLNINGTAKANGTFDMSMTCQPGLDQKMNTTFADLNIDMVENNYKNDFCAVNDDTMSFNAELLMPGSFRAFTTKITNSGTMDAYLNFDTGVEENLKTCFDGLKGMPNGAIEDEECITGGFGSEAHLLGIVGIEPMSYGFEKADGTILNINSSEEELAEFVSEDGDLILKPGYSVYLLSAAYMDDRIGTNDGGGFFIKSEGTLKLNFTQTVSN